MMNDQMVMMMSMIVFSVVMVLPVIIVISSAIKPSIVKSSIIPPVRCPYRAAGNQPQQGSHQACQV